MIERVFNYNYLYYKSYIVDKMLAFLFSILWSLGPYIFIVIIGDYITRSITDYNMQSVKSSKPSKRKRKRTRITKKTDQPWIISAVNTECDFEDQLFVEATVNIDGDFEDQFLIQTTVNTERDFEDQPFIEAAVNIDSDLKDQTWIETTINIDSKYIERFENSVNYQDLTDFLSSTDRNVAKVFNMSTEMSKYIVVNESVFVDSEPTMVSDEECQDYRLFKVMKTKSGTDVHQNDYELTEEDLTETLFITEEMTNNGVIINNNVFLNYEQWHTIQRPTELDYSCIVCQVEGNQLEMNSHIASRCHVRKLDRYRPLKRFDLSIIRKIDENLHCGVCNEIFPITKYREHENSKTHEGYLLFAINKVSDIMWMEQDCKESQIIETNNIQPPNNAPYTRTLQDIITLPDRNDWCDNGRTESDIEGRKVNRTSSNTPLRDRSTDSNSSIDRTHRFDKISDLVKNGDLSKANTDSTNEHSFNFEKNTYKDIKIYEEDEIEEYTLPIEGVSYASMASKPRLAVPKFYKIDLGTKEVRVKFESWNMITQTSVNEYYCMGCTDSFPVRFKATHCMSDKHRRVLALCSVVGAFEDYLIRDVSEKLYHCGHCNNLQYKNDMKIHVEKYHPVKNPKNIPDRPPLKPIEPQEREMNIAKVKLDIFGDFTFAPFGAEITVSNLGCHTLMLVNNQYLCALCNVYVQGNLIDHVYEATHMRLINMAPFIKPFQCNLTRAVRGSLHCALCNILVPVTGITDHNVDSAHIQALARALGMVKNERPKQEVKYHFEEPIEFKTDIERFLSTLPPNTREVLSRLKISNHKGEMFQLSDTNSSASSNGTASPMSLMSPERTKDTIKEPVDLEVSYPQDRVSPRQPDLGYPIEGAAGIKQDGIGPKNGVETDVTPGVGYFRPEVNSIPKGIENITPNIHPMNRALSPRYPIGAQGINPPLYPGVKNNVPYPYTNNVAQPFTPRMLTVSMVESGLTRAQPGSPTIQVPMDLKNGSIPTDLKNNSWPPSLPIHKPEGMEVANQMVFHKQKVQTKVDEPVKTGLSEIVPEKTEAKKGKDIGKVQEKTATVDSNKPEAKKKKKSLESESEKEILSPFKLDQIVLLKQKSSYFKVTSTSYHTLVHLGNGMRQCFVCSSLLDYSALSAHVGSSRHLEKIDQIKFLYNFCGQLFRQMYRTYHCTICNVLMSKRDVPMHLEWNTHINKYNSASKTLNKKFITDVLKSGALKFNIKTQKETLYDTVPEPIDIVTYIQSTNEDFEETYIEKKVERKSQIIILKGNVMKLSFECWHGFLVSKGGVKCILCQQELTETELLRHLSTAPHIAALTTAFEKEYYPALIRKINKNTVNCVICNRELPNDDSLVKEHISGRKHYKTYNTIIENASHSDTNSDCNKHHITL